MKLPRGIARTPYGFRAFVQRRHVKRCKRFPPDTPVQTMRDWRERERSKINLGLVEQARAGPPAEDFAADAARYLKTVKGMRSFRDRERHVNLWVAVFGSRRRAEITPPDITAQLEVWRAEGKSASTLNHLRGALMHVYRVLDAHTNAANPVDKTKHYREPEPEARSLPYATVRAILERPPDCVTRARMGLMAWAGLTPEMIKGLRPEHWNREAHTLYVLGRKKGAGTRARVVDLMPQAEDALKALDSWNGWGTFDTSAMNRAFRRRTKALKVDPRATVYWLRHSFGTAVYAHSKDIQATAELLGHADARITTRYTVAALSPAAKGALDAFTAAENGTKKSPENSPARKKRRKKR